jgi:DNA invertase Pin-like site-specific DNA recombinase
MKKYVAYYRVSTQRQGASGLGVEAQQAAVRTYVGSASILNEYTEIESGKQNQRPKLLAAIKEAKAAGATLLIAKLDRLSRNAGFIFSLRDSGVDFVCADMPDANTLTVGIFAVLAQHERELISQRTKAALTAKKDRGDALGTPANLDAAARAKGLATRQGNAATAEANVKAAYIIADKQLQGWKLQQIADHLNNVGYRTRRGCLFTACAVQRLAPASVVA